MVRNDEKCRKCKHTADLHGMWRNAGIGEGTWRDIILVKEIACCGLLEDYNTLCKCPCFLPQDNLLYLERLSK